MSGECDKCGEHCLDCKCKSLSKNEKNNTDIIKCNQCGQVLISGHGMIAIFGPGTSIECRKCGNKHTF